MILEAHPGMNEAMRTVFTIFAAFWVGVLIILFIATGFLLKKAERLRQKQQHH